MLSLQGDLYSGLEKKLFVFLKTNCVFYVNVCRERHGTEGSNVSGASLEHSSSVEVGQLNYITARAIPTFGNIKSDLVWQKRTSFVFVSSFCNFQIWPGRQKVHLERIICLCVQVLSEMEDEAKFESDINSGFF